MRRRHRQFAVLLLGVMCGVGCSGSKGSSSTSSTGGPIRNQKPELTGTAAHQLAQARCWQILNCKGLTIDTVFGGKEQCVAMLEAEENIPLPPDAVVSDAQRLICAVDLLAAPCVEAMYEGVPSCLRVGPRAEGAACALDGQCQSGWCDGATGVACGQCRARLLEGDICQSLGELKCPAGMGCVTGDSYVTCGVPGRLGQACHGVENQHRRCSMELQCVETAQTGSWVCASLPQLGDPCPLFGECSSGTSCENFGSRTCIPTPIAEAGEPCGPMPMTDILTQCRAGRCDAPSWNAPGTCAGRGDNVPCQNNDRCVYLDECIHGTCQPRAYANCP